MVPFSHVPFSRILVLSQPRTILTALGLAFADLTVHMATQWSSFIDALSQQLNEPQDVQALLLCLKVRNC